MRRSLALLCASTLAVTGLVVAAPAGAAPAPQASSTAGAAVPDELLVGYQAGATAADRDRARGRASAHRQSTVVAAAADRAEVELVRIPQGDDRDRAIAELESDPAVAYAEPNWIYSHQADASDPYYLGTDPSRDLWGMYGDKTAPLTNAFGSQAGEAWAAGHVGSATVFVGVIDEGVQFDHPDLLGQVGNPGETADGVDNDGNGLVDDVHGWDFVNEDSSVYDGGTRGNLDDHGTHVSGTIGAKADGVGVVGVNHRVGLISGKFLGRNGGSLADAVQAVDYFTDLKTKRGLDVVATNNSWGGGGFSQALLDAITRASIADILFIAAAGNNGSDNDSTASYPSSYDVPNVIAVAAIDRSGGLASFSQYGKTTVDLGAPGVDVWSTTAYSGYSQYDGTSMATPHVTGAVALYKAANPTATASAIRDRLLAYTNPTPSLTGKTVTGGRLDAARMISGEGTPTETTPTEPAPDTGTRTVTLSKGPKVKNVTEVTATWSGYTGTSVDVTRNGSTFATANDGHLAESWRGSGTLTYKICETGTTTCAQASITI